MIGPASLRPGPLRCGVGAGGLPQTHPALAPPREAQEGGQWLVESAAPPDRRTTRLR